VNSIAAFSQSGALVIDALVGAEILRTRKLLIDRRCDDDLHTHCVRQLQREDRDAARTLQQDGLAGDDLPVFH
jgi:hypothetical protein